MSREALPNRRECETIKLRHGNGRAAYHATITRYDDGRPANVFISTNQVGTALDAMARDSAILLSLALQYGCPIETIQKALTREADGSPQTVVCRVADKLTERQT